jgi:putative membrane protein
MLQHMLLSIVAPPLMVAGLPASMVEAWLRFPIIARMERILSYAPLTLVAWVATIWAWHLPYLYNLALENERIHVFEHLMIIVTGFMLWWPVLKPIQAGRLAPMAALGYMGVAASLGMILGIIFTVADTPFYSFYEHPHDELGALKMIREDWGLTQIEDQKLGGAIMWEPMGAIFLWAILAVLIEWFKQSKHEVLQKTQESDRRAENV